MVLCFPRKTDIAKHLLKIQMYRGGSNEKNIINDDLDKAWPGSIIDCYADMHPFGGPTLTLLLLYWLLHHQSVKYVIKITLKNKCYSCRPAGISIYRYAGWLCARVLLKLPRGYNHRLCQHVGLYTERQWQMKHETVQHETVRHDLANF